MPLVDGFEEIEAIAVIDILRRTDIEVVVAAVSEPEHLVRGSHHISLQPDSVLAKMWSDTLVNQFDALVLPGGPGTNALLANAQVAQLVRQFDKARKCTAAICAAPLLLSQVGILRDRTATSFPGVRDRLEVGRYSTERVVVDGHIVTSRGAGTAVEFALQLVAELVGPARAQEISTAIVANWSPSLVPTGLRGG
jgi:4-methyl-5(b-hydroxyethyl)-thiazole monophosphate biosynthesis